MERGVKYVTSTGYDVPGLTQANTNTAQYALVVVKGKSITYEFKPIVP